MGETVSLTLAPALLIAMLALVIYGPGRAALRAVSGARLGLTGERCNKRRSGWTAQKSEHQIERGAS
jgi:hypothetical protein